MLQRKYQRSALQTFCDGSSLVTGWFPLPRVGNAEIISVPWSNHIFWWSDLISVCWEIPQTLKHSKWDSFNIPFHSDNGRPMLVYRKRQCKWAVSGLWETAEVPISLVSPLYIGDEATPTCVKTRNNYKGVMSANQGPCPITNYCHQARTVLQSECKILPNIETAKYRGLIFSYRFPICHRFTPCNAVT